MKKILIVDDEEGIHYLFEAKMRKLDISKSYQLEFAFDGIEALEKIQNDDSICFLITDINMPGMDGLQLLRELEGREIKLPSYVISSYNDEDRVSQAEKIGVKGYFFKPFVAKNLLEKLSKELLSI